MLFDILDKLIPTVIVFVLIRGILTTILGKNKRRQEPMDEYPDGSTEYDYGYEDEENYTPAPSPAKRPTPAEIFEEKMREKEAAKQRTEHNGIGGAIVHDGSRILRDGAIEKDGSSVFYDGEQESDGSVILKDRVMEKDGSTIRYGNDVVRDADRENDGSVVFGDKTIIPDYKPMHSDDCRLPHERGRVYREPVGSYGNIGNVSLNQSSAPLQVEGAKKRRRRFKHASLVNGVIMEEILGKPRALKPYGEED